MTTKTHFSIRLVIIFAMFWYLKAQSQDMGAVYWFKKGVNEKDLKKKIEFYQKAVQEKPDFVEAHYNLALTYMINKDYQKAEATFKNALSVNPASLNNALKSNILNRLGSMYRKMGRYTEAEEAFQGTLNITSDNKFKAITLYELGQTKISQGQYHAAIDYFNQGIEVSPGDRASFETGIQLARNEQKIAELYTQGIQLIQSQQLSKAADIFNQIIDLNPNHDAAKTQIEKIAALLAQKEETRTQQVQPLYEQAMTYLNKGDWLEAIKYFERIKHLQPNFPNIDTLLSRAQQRQYQQLLKEQQLDNFYVQGVDHFDKGNYTVALLSFQKVAELDPNYKDVTLKIQTTQREINHINEFIDSVQQSNETNVTASEDNIQFNLANHNITSAIDFNTQGLYTEPGKPINATVDSQLIYNYYKEALDLMQNEEWQRAVILLEKVKLITPKYKNTEFLLGQARQNIEMIHLQIAYEAAANSRSNTSPLVMLAFLSGIVIIPLGLLFVSPATRAKYYTFSKKYDKAREIYERMLSKQPNNIKLYITLANIYINENRVDDVAIRIFERAIQFNDNLKMQLEPIVMRYYLKKSNISDTSNNLIQGDLEEELKKMGN